MRNEPPHPAEMSRLGDDGCRLSSLNALRGIAILLVIVSHFAPASLTALTGNQSAMLVAYSGVILFFTLSGFLMDRTLSFDRSLISYTVRRAARILPIYWLSLLMAFAIGSWTLRDLFINAAFLVPVAKTELMSGVYWTLYVEVLFYCIAPILIYSGDRAVKIAPYLFIAIDIVIWLVRGEPSHAIYHLTYCLLGMQYGAWYRGALSGAGLAIAATVITLSASLLSPVSILVGLSPLISGILLWYALRKERQIAILSFFGDVSYGWYLTHAVVGLPLTAIIVRNGASDWQAALAGAGVALLLSWVVFRTIERPSIRFGKTLIRNWVGHRVLRADRRSVPSVLAGDNAKTGGRAP